MFRVKSSSVFSCLLLLTCLTSCNRQYKIEGSSSITSLDGKTLFLKTLKDGDWVTVDSAEMVHGLFKMDGPADSVMMVTLYMNDDPVMPLILEKGKIQVTLSNSQPQAKGTPLNDALYEFIRKHNDLQVKLGELDRKEARMVLDGADIDEVHRQVEAEGEALLKEINEYVRKFITDNYENVLGPGVFSMMCNSLPYPVMTPEIEELVKGAPAAFLENAYVKDFLSKARENMRLIEEHQRLQENVILNQKLGQGQR